MKIAQHEKSLRHRKYFIKAEDEETEIRRRSPLELSFCKTPQPSRFNKPTSPTFTISTASRFGKDIFEKFNSMLYTDMSFYFKSRRKLVLSRSSVKSNKNMKPHSPVEKIARLKTMSIKNESRQMVTKLAKSTIVQHRKEMNQQRLNEKFKKLFFRQGKQVFSKVHKSWMSLLCLYGTFKQVKLGLIKGKMRKKRINSILKQFKILTVFIGKLLHRLNYIKRKLSIKKLTKMVKHCKIWAATRYQCSQKHLLKFSDIFLNKVMFRSMISGFFKKLVFMQRTLRAAVKTRRELIETVIEMWNEQEALMFNKIIINEASNRRNSKILMNLNSVREISLIPAPYKIKKIVKKIKEFVGGYIDAMKNYNAAMKMRKSMLAMNWLSNGFDGFRKKRPVSPDIVEEFTEDVLIEMISKAMKKRKNIQRTHRARNI